MFCRKCGKEIFDNAEYCEECLAEKSNLENSSPQQDQSAPSQQDSTNYNQSYQPQYVNNTSSTHSREYKMCCPSCKSRNLQIVTNTEFHSQTKGGGYSAGKGCCGYMALGPLGLLCGACGSKSQTTISSSSTNVWVCRDCGNRFRDLNEIDNEIDKAKKNQKVGMLGLISFAVILIIIPLISLSMSGADLAFLFSHMDLLLEAFALPGMLSIFCLIMAVVAYKGSQKRIVDLENERYYIQTTAFKYE